MRRSQANTCEAESERPEAEQSAKYGSMVFKTGELSNVHRVFRFSPQSTREWGVTSFYFATVFITFSTAQQVSNMSCSDRVGCTRSIRLASPNFFATGRRCGGRNSFGKAFSR